MTEIIVTENVSVVSFNAIPLEKANAFLCKVFGKAAESGINLDMISKVPSTSDAETIGFTFSDEVMPRAVAIFNNMKSDGIPAPLINCGNIKITVSSKEMIENTGFVAKIYSAICETSSVPLLISTGLDEISILVSENDGAELSEALKARF